MSTNLTATSVVVRKESPKYQYNPVPNHSPGIELHEMPTDLLQIRVDRQGEASAVIQGSQPDRVLPLTHETPSNEMEMTYMPSRQKHPDTGAGLGLSPDHPSPDELRITIPQSADRDEMDEKYPDRLMTVPLTPPPGRTQVPQTQQQSVQEHRVDIREEVPQQQQPPHGVEEEHEPSGCGPRFAKALGRLCNFLSPARMYREWRHEKQVKKEAKAARKQAAKEKLERQAAFEKSLGEYHTAMYGLVRKLLGKDAHLTVNPESLQRAEDEYMHCNNPYPVFNREADITAGGKNYHVRLMELRKADTDHPTRYGYMYPHKQGVKEADQEGSYPLHTILQFNLTGPEPEKLQHKLWPNTGALFPDTELTDATGKTHKRSFAYLRNSGERRDIRRGDGYIDTLSSGVRSAMNRTEIRGVIDRHIADAHENQRVKALLDYAFVYKPPVQPPAQGRVSKKQKKKAHEQLVASKTAFAERRETVETHIKEVLAQKKPQQQRQKLLELIQFLDS